jgi:hypothetical protein
MLATFDRRVAQIPADLCAPFHEEARQLETTLLTIHGMASLLARKEQDLANISGIWGAMVDLCDASTKKLAELVRKHPYCGAQLYYDRLLDLRNRCQRLQQMHS